MTLVVAIPATAHATVLPLLPQNVHIDIPFGVHAGPDECAFTRWHPRH